MIIDCGNRRLVSDRYGWMIQIKRTIKKGERAGETEWREDRPAYPATLSQGCQMLAERILKESDTVTPDGMVEALQNAVHQVNRYMEMARRAA